MQSVARSAVVLRGPASGPTPAPAPAPAPGPTPAPAPALEPSLDERVNAILAASRLGSVASISVRDAATGESLLARDDARSVPPASNAKLLTAMAALDVLGPEHRFQTRVTGAAPRADGTIAGDLRIIGGGDPALSTAGLQDLVDQLAKSGVRRIDGSVTTDDSLLDRTRWVSTWPQAARLRDARALGALAIAQDVDGVRIPPASAPEPDVHVGKVFTQLLDRRGITVAGRKLASSDAPTIMLAAHESPPLREQVEFMLRRSNSTTAELLARHVGRAAGEDATTAAGASAIRSTLGIADPGSVILDGSGLSRAGRTTTGELTRQLSASTRQPGAGGSIHDLLGVSGVSGTIASRMTSPDLIGRVHAKTGTLRDTSALSGYLDRADRQQLAFSVIMHPIQRSDGSEARALQDALIGALAAQPTQ